MEREAIEPGDMEDLMNPDSWDFSGGDSRTNQAKSDPPRRAPRAVLSVAFQRADFEKVERYATEQGQKISEVVRNATMAYVSGAIVLGSGIRMVSAGGKDLKSDVSSLHPTTAGSPHLQADNDVDRTA
jgi:uncharacterized protein (UPF0264 family)